MLAEQDRAAEMLVCVARGDKHALRRLYDMSAPRLLAIACRLLGGRRDLAEDVLQEAFVAIWMSAGRFDPARGKAQPWLAAIVRRKAIDRLRASPWIVREVAEDVGLAAPPEADAQALAVRACLEKLDANQAQAIRLAYFYGLTHMELSKAMGAPLGTVKSWLRRGLLALGRCLEG